MHISSCDRCMCRMYWCDMTHNTLQHTCNTQQHTVAHSYTTALTLMGGMCVAVCCSVLHCRAVSCDIHVCGRAHVECILCCSVLQYVLQCVAVCVPHDTAHVECPTQTCMSVWESSHTGSIVRYARHQLSHTDIHVYVGHGPMSVWESPHRHTCLWES